MREWIGYSGQNLSIEEIAYQYKDTERALRQFISDHDSSDPALLASSPDEVLEARLILLDSSTTLTLFAAVEAVFKIDFHVRVSEKHRDKLSKEFQRIYAGKADKNRISLDDDIFDTWRAHIEVSGGERLINELNMAFTYRNWLAHGRYRRLKDGQKRYDYFGLYALAHEVFEVFDLKQPRTPKPRTA